MHVTANLLLLKHAVPAMLDGSSIVMFSTLVATGFSRTPMTEGFLGIPKYEALNRRESALGALVSHEPSQRGPKSAPNAVTSDRMQFSDCGFALLFQEVKADYNSSVFVASLHLRHDPVQLSEYNVDRAFGLSFRQMPAHLGQSVLQRRLNNALLVAEQAVYCARCHFAFTAQSFYSECRNVIFTQNTVGAIIDSLAPLRHDHACLSTTLDGRSGCIGVADFRSQSFPKSFSEIQTIQSFRSSKRRREEARRCRGIYSHGISQKAKPRSTKVAAQARSCSR
ncbi:hypothetical protein [Novosphingobium sp. Chol11]|uniref:hypothetical protein n=1 Tax=Novosphingobium sp. Chol11 TaxID=1385763 RepID=UPI0025DDE957|nr:hypothetical protein [Novosphingobium sp. Chol11]